MSTLIDFAYAQARLQARYGELPEEPVWRRLEGSASLAHYLQSARNTSLKHWLYDIGPDTPVHDMERSLRRSVRAQIDEVAQWQPKRWRAAVQWLKVLIDLPALSYVRAGHAPLHWMYDDPTLELLLSRSEAGDAALLAAQADQLRATWRQVWRDLWPPLSDARKRPLIQLEKATTDWRMALGEEETPSDRADERLGASFRRLFRRNPHTAASAFAYLGLFALDFRRLRGGLIRRSLFADGGSLREARR